MPDPRRRAVTLTPLIDVIFLLLLFFMLTTTFTRTGEIRLTAAGAGSGGVPPIFLRVGAEELLLNGDPVDLDALADRVIAMEEQRLLIALAQDVRAQRLADVLHALRRVPDLRAQVLEG